MSAPALATSPAAKVHGSDSGLAKLLSQALTAQPAANEPAARSASSTPASGSSTPAPAPASTPASPAPASTPDSRPAASSSASSDHTPRAYIPAYAAGVHLSIPHPIDGIPVPVISTSGTSFGGSAGVPLVYVDALDIPGTIDLAAADVAPAESVVDSSGVAGQATGIHSYARANNVDASLVSGNLNANLLLPKVQATSTGSPAPVTGGVLDVPASPLADVDVVANSAHAVFPQPLACSSTPFPLSAGVEQLASADVLPVLAGSASVLSVSNTKGGTVYTKSEVAVAQAPGQTHTEGVDSTAITQVTDVNLFGGEFQLEVAAPPTLTAVATGEPGGAKVTYNEPVITVLSGSTVLGTLSNLNTSLNLALGPLTLGTLTLGTLSDVVTAANGTKASGSASLVDLTVDPAGALPVVNVQIAPATASATVPVGGVACGATSTPEPNPLTESHKDLSASTVPAGQSFNYTITVPNRGACTLTDVKVADTIPTGLTFDSSVPAPTSDSGGVLTYDIGTLAPNATDNITLTFTVPAGTGDGVEYTNDATITGSCGSTGYTVPVSVTGPTVGAVGTGACNLKDSNKASDHIDVVPGETFNYYVHVFNTGGEPCDAVNVSDSLQPGVGFVGCSNGCTVSGTTVTWSDLGTLASGASLTLSLEVKATATSGTLSNVAAVGATGTAPVTVTATGPIVTDVSVLAPPDPAVYTPGTGTLAFTGGRPWLAVLGLLLVALRGGGPQVPSRVELVRRG